ncbi:MAG: TlpA family protein disulfide reductase [Bacteroidetes bacterium]|nr:TlpA family protein disulfide reductase [Bacteroidota bacterium]
MSIKKILLISFLFYTAFVKSQTVSKVYKIDELLNRIKNPDTTYVINFWATWCKPCVAELPSFDSLSKISNVKILLVSLDFKEDLEKKVNFFLQKNKIKIECVLLDEINGNDFINKIDKSWTGAIPATLIKNKEHRVFIEKKIHLAELQKKLADVERK